MGKKSKFKKIRRIASQLPVINQRRVVGERVSGEELIKEGVKEVQGKPVQPLDQYKKKKVVVGFLNHNRKMKQLFNKGGAPLVNSYIKAVMAYSKKAK